MSALTLATNAPAPQHPLCSGTHKERLLIGEGNFSFALALINKHDAKVGHTPQSSLARSIVATEYQTEKNCDECLALEFLSHNLPSNESEEPILCETCETTAARIEELQKRGATVYLGIDGTKINQIEEFKNRNFRRIHWNCPHDGSNMKDQTLPTTLSAFFRACGAIQQDPDSRVHITLAQPQPKKTANFYQGYYYNIVRAASVAGYTLLKKRKFSTTRYLGYEHVQTNKNEKAAVTDQGLREFVFKKVDSTKFIEAYQKNRTQDKKLPIRKFATDLAKDSPKPVTIREDKFYDQPRTFYDCLTDDDSSDCE